MERSEYRKLIHKYVSSSTLYDRDIDAMNLLEHEADAQRALDGERERVKELEGNQAEYEKRLTTLRQLVEAHTKQLTELTIIPIGCSREQELRWTQSIKDLRATLAAKDAGKHHEVD